MISNEKKLQIVEELKRQTTLYPSNIRLAWAIGIDASQLSRLLKGDVDKVISDAKWINIAQKFNVPLREVVEVTTARTTVFDFIWRQLEFVQQNSVAGMICDRPDIGKTHTAKAYARENANVVYIDCGENRTAQAFVRAIAQGFGLDSKQKFAEVRDTLVFYVRSMQMPLIILDEFGDLTDPAYLEFKTLWNATDRYCGWYAMGADGLKKKVETKIINQVVGFAEIFSRMGNRFQRVTPLDDKSFQSFQKKQISQIGRVNGCTDNQQLIAKTDFSLRRIPIQLGLERKNNEDPKDVTEDQKKKDENKKGNADGNLQA